MTFDQVKELSLYEKRLLLGYVPARSAVMKAAPTESDAPPEQKRRPRRGHG